MTPYDYAVLVFYFGYMLAISWVFRKFVTNISDYFRGGGKAVWWMVGGSAFMAAFSAWTFTGAASKAYTDGWPVMAIYVANAVGFVSARVDSEQNQVDNCEGASERALDDRDVADPVPILLVGVGLLLFLFV